MSNGFASCHFRYRLIIALKDIFRYGLNKPIKSWLLGGEINYPLLMYMDYALVLSGSPYL